MSLGGLQSLCLQPRKTPTSQRMSQTSTVSRLFLSILMGQWATMREKNYIYLTWTVTSKGLSPRLYLTATNPCLLNSSLLRSKSIVKIWTKAPLKDRNSRWNCRLQCKTQTQGKFYVYVSSILGLIRGLADLGRHCSTVRRRAACAESGTENN
jgi:hypothetical protein